MRYSLAGKPILKLRVAISLLTYTVVSMVTSKAAYTVVKTGTINATGTMNTRSTASTSIWQHPYLVNPYTAGECRVFDPRELDNGIAAFALRQSLERLQERVAVENAAFGYFD